MTYDFMTTDENPAQKGSLVKHAQLQELGIGIIKEAGYLWESSDEDEEKAGTYGFLVSWPGHGDTPALASQLLWLEPWWSKDPSGV